MAVNDSPTGCPSIDSRSEQSDVIAPTGATAGDTSSPSVPNVISEMADGSTTVSPNRRSRVVRSSAPMISNVASARETGRGKVRVALGAVGTGRSNDPLESLTRSAVIGENVPSDCVTVIDDAVSSSRTFTALPTGEPNDVIHEVAGSPSKAAAPLAAGTPVR